MKSLWRIIKIWFGALWLALWMLGVGLVGLFSYPIIAVIGEIQNIRYEKKYKKEKEEYIEVECE